MVKRPNLTLIYFIFALTSIVYLIFPKYSLSTDDIGTWINNTSMPDSNNIASHFSLVYNNKLYVLGGANNSVGENGIYSTIGDDGQLSAWSEISSKPNQLWSAGANFGNKVYLLGGANSGVRNISDVKLGIIGPSGDINLWTDVTPLPSALSLGGATIIGNRIYHAGGTTSGQNPNLATDDIWMAEIDNSTGILSDWTLAGKLPEALIKFGMVNDNGYIIIVGGESPSGTSDRVMSTKINNDGTIGNWNTQPNLLYPNNRGSITKLSDHIILAGGYTPTLTDKVMYSTVNDGNVSGWIESTNSLPYSNCCSPMSSWSNHLFITGGHNGSSYISSVISSTVNFFVSTPSPIPTESATPSASPNASPTVSPTATASATPTTTPIVLNVPNLKQYSLPWKNKLYAFTQKTIHEFGCALTSAAMVLQYHGHNINPDKLNDWLKNEPDGYIRNGLINWLAITRYTKLHDTANSPSLEFKRLLPTNENLTNELTNNRPAILKENGHFVVAKSILGNTFGINDPGYSNRSDLTSYNNSFLAINSFTPSHTDLSYMMFVVDPNINLKLFDNNNNPVDSQEFIEDPINNLIKPNQKSGSPVKILILSKPQNGKYTLKLTGSKGKYNLDSYLYDVNGKVTTNKFEGKLNSDDTDKFTINFENRKSIKDKDKKSDFKFWFKDIFDFFKYFYKN